VSFGVIKIQNIFHMNKLLLVICYIVDCVDGIDAHTMFGYVIHDVRKAVNVHIPYPAEYDGVKGGCAFHHGRFIMALRKAAQAESK